MCPQNVSKVKKITLEQKVLSCKIMCLDRLLLLMDDHLFMAMNRQDHSQKDYVLNLSWKLQPQDTLNLNTNTNVFRGGYLLYIALHDL